MFYSLVQTLVCVLLINGGLYALHLNGNGGADTGNAAGAGPPGLLAGSQLQMLNSGRDHVVHAKQSAGLFDSNGRLSEELADLAQLERERLMLLGIAKQTAAANAAAASGHHGRPIITGRIHMSPTEDMVGEADYGGILMSPARGYMFGHVVKQPTTVTETDNLKVAAEFSGAGDATLRPAKYEYGRLVQPIAEQTEYETAAHLPLDLDAFMELEQEQEQEAEPDDDDFDLDGYQYLDELLAEQQQRNWQEKLNQERANNPYYGLEELGANAPVALRELFNKEQHKIHGTSQQQQQQQQQQHQQYQRSQAQARNGFKPSNIRLQQKWQRKRAQQQLPLQRNIFGQKKHTNQQQQQQQHDEAQDAQIEPHYFNQRHHTLLSTSGSEATANAKNNNINNNNNNNNDKETNKHDEKTTNVNILEENLKSAVNTVRNHNYLQQQQQQQQQSQQSDILLLPNNNNNQKLDLKQSTSTQNKDTENTQAQQTVAEENLLMHPNHKRSGSSVLLPSALSAAGSHSIASQLMLRTARGQRQYDVPQIECPTAMDGMERFACPTPDLQGRYRCIDDHVLCDGFIDCPEGEDEDRRSCMFYKTTKAHLDVLADALLRWARGR